MSDARKVYDTFIFFNELDLLEMRLELLYEHVDTFVLVESATTFSGKPKPLHFMENRDRFARWGSKIRHIVAPPMQGQPGPWLREAQARNDIGYGLHDAAPDDWVFMSDADELWNPAFRDVGDSGGLINYVGPLSYYYLNVQCGGGGGSKRIPFRSWRGGQHLRTSNPADTDVHNGGWHFSYLGGVDKIIEKVGAYSHTELNLPQYMNVGAVQRAMQTQRDLFGRELTFRVVPIDDSFPRPVVENRERWQHLVCPEQP